MSNILKVLVVDDIPDWINLHSEILKSIYKENIEITTALSAKDALETIDANLGSPFHMVISDLEMERVPDGDYAGAWLIRNLQQKPELKDTRFLIISGSCDIQKVAAKLDVPFIPKDLLITNPLLLKYQVISAS